MSDERVQETTPKRILTMDEAEAFVRLIVESFRAAPNPSVEIAVDEILATVEPWYIAAVNAAALSPREGEGGRGFPGEDREALTNDIRAVLPASVVDLPLVEAVTAVREQAERYREALTHLAETYRGGVRVIAEQALATLSPPVPETRPDE